MELEALTKIFGDKIFKLCVGKKAKDSVVYGIEDAKKWLSQGKQIGIWCPKNYVIIDIDSKIEADIVDKLTKTLKCRTPHGMHFYFKTNSEVRQVVHGHTPIGVRIDTRVAEKGYCLLPYNCNDREWIDGDICELPFWLKPLTLPASAEQYILPRMEKGAGRNDAILRQIMRLRKEKFSEKEIQKIANIINNSVFASPLEEKEIVTVLGSANKYQPFENKIQKENDFCLYNEKGIVNGINHKALIDYMVMQYPMFTLGGSIYVYQKGVFVNNALIVRDIIKTLIANPKFQKQSQINEIFNMLMDDIRLSIQDKMCNTYKRLINFKNGMFDIDKQILLPHSPNYLSTIQIPHDYVATEYDKNDIQLFDFFKRTKIAEDDLNMILDYLAYSMTTQNGLKCFMCLVGGSNTGKSTLIKMVDSLIGKENISSLSIQDMSVRFYPARLKDKLINSCADNSSLALNDIGNLKKITGDDEIMYEDKGATPYFFTPFAKLWFSFNALPLQLEERSDAFYSRIRILEMNNKITLTQQYVDDLSSPESISGIIPYLCKRLKNLKAIKPSARSLEYTEKLRSESDSLHWFVYDKLKFTGDIRNKITYEEMYLTYTRLCNQWDRVVQKKATFYDYLDKLNIKACKDKITSIFIGYKVE